MNEASSTRGSSDQLGGVFAGCATNITTRPVRSRRRKRASLTLAIRQSLPTNPHGPTPSQIRGLATSVLPPLESKTALGLAVR